MGQLNAPESVWTTYGREKKSYFCQESKPRILERPARSSCVRTHTKTLTLEHHAGTLFTYVWPSRIVTSLVEQKAEWTTKRYICIQTES
jgi:hypothetical protein